jgi:hypothetical protein
LTGSLLESPTSSSLAGQPAARIGSQTPRVRRVPAYERTHGDEVVDFMAEIGRPLDPWQAAITLDAFAVRLDGLWSAFELLLLLSRQNGKGGVTEAIELGGLFLFREPLIMHSAHQFKTSTAAFRRLQDIIEGSDWLTRRVKMISRSKGDESIELTRQAGGGRLQFVARTLGSGRGLTGSKTVFDEAWALTVGQYAAQTPTLATIPNPQIIYTTTPPDDDIGPVPEDAMLPSVRARGHAGADRIACYEWSPPEEFDPHDREIWYECNPSLGIRISEWFLEKQLDNFEAAGRVDKFSTEHLCVWPLDPNAAGWFVFTEAEWTGCLDGDSVLAGEFAFAFEASHDLAWLSVGAAGRRDDGLRHLELVDRFPADVGRAVGWLKKRLRDPGRRPVAVCIDPAGPAGYLIPEIEKHCGIEVLKPRAQDVAAWCGSVYVGITGKESAARDVRVRGAAPPFAEAGDAEDRHAIALQESLHEAARRVVWRDRGDAKVFDRRVDDESADVAPLISVTLADWAAMKLGGRDYDVLESVWIPQ